jgi:hypothetical protein
MIVEKLDDAVGDCAVSILFRLGAPSIYTLFLPSRKSSEPTVSKTVNSETEVS